MKKSLFVYSTLFTLTLGTPAWAAPLKLVFYYPGGQGSQQQAQPILDSFSEGLAKASGGKIKAQVFYIQSAQDGIQFIENQKPAGGILGLDVFYQKSSPWQAEVIARSLQIPSGDGTDQYFILGNVKNPLPASGKIILLASRPLDPKFVRNKLFPNLKNEIEIQTSPLLVSQIRKIGRGELKGWVLLDNFENATISKIRSDWGKNLKSFNRSPKISSAPFVVFKNNLSPETATQLQDALVKLSKDPHYRETLQLLRLTGFKRADSVE